MGGHGGLNILPQKKWNVYNHDNRAIVDRDKKLHAQKQKKKAYDQRDKQIQGKIEVLKGEREPQIKTHSLLTLQMKRMADEKKHINLFENEQKMIANQELLQAKMLKEEEFLKDKNMDFSSRFLGTYNDKSKMPWYSMRKGYEPEKIMNKAVNQGQTSMIHANKTDSQITREVGASIQHHSKFENPKDYKSNAIKQKDHKYQIYDRYDRSNKEQRERSRDHKYQKGTKTVKNQTKQHFPQDPLEELRLKRLKRQEKERAKAEQLKRKFN